MEKFDGNFRLIDTCDIAPLLAKVRALGEEDWGAVDWRQQRFDAHKYTQTIELIFDRDFRHENPTKHAMYDRLDGDAVVGPILESIADFYTGEGYPVRLLLVRLLAKGRIPQHVDTGYSLTTARRIHVPVITNDGVIFTVGGEARALPPGEIWEINNTREHSVENTSDQNRVHLIVDWVVT
jgi:hypothetical protein